MPDFLKFILCEFRLKYIIHCFTVFMKSPSIIMRRVEYPVNNDDLITCIK